MHTGRALAALFSIRRAKCLQIFTNGGGDGVWDGCWFATTSGNGPVGKGSPGAQRDLHSGAFLESTQLMSYNKWEDMTSWTSVKKLI